MAEVVDLAGNSPAGSILGGKDNKLSHPNRTNAGSPVSALTPLYPGEVIEDTTNRLLWRASGTTSTDWMPIVQDA